MILAIDTATRLASLALFDPDQETVRAESTWQSQANHTVELTSNLQSMLISQQLTPNDLTTIAVARGPGSFTGLRIGMSLAKAIAYVEDIPIIGVPTPDIIAQAHAGHELPLWVILHAGRNHVLAVCYPVDGPAPTEDDYQITTLAGLAEDIKQPALFSGEIDARGATQLRQILGACAVIVPPAARLRRSAYLAELGQQRLVAGEVDDPATLTPIYVHRPGL